MAAMITGTATASGTEQYAKRFEGTVAEGHFRPLHGAVLAASVGIGTYLGADDTATDARYVDAVGRALGAGINVIDTAVNYRHQRSERAVGAALARASGAVDRDAVIVATKGGFIPFDGVVPRDPVAYFRDTYVRTGIVQPGDVAGGAHCMAPRFLADQIERSRANLGLETVDIYYVHNPETQLEEVERDEFMRRIRDAFAALEGAVAERKIGCYGTATWNGFRQDPSARGYLPMAELVAAARDVGGADHHFKVVQLPYNLAMPEAFTRANQLVANEMLPAVEAARRLGLYVMVSASVYQGQLTRNLPPVVGQLLPGLATDAQRAIQFVRSTPGIGTALVGMMSAAHVAENAAIAAVPPLEWDRFKNLFAPA